MEISTPRFSTYLRVVLGLATALLARDADAKLEKRSPATAAFHAQATPGGLRIDGTTSDVDVGDDGMLVTITIHLERIATGISLRDRHTRKYLEVEKYPTATFRVPRAALRLEGGNAEVSGTLTIHGRSKEKQVTYQAVKRGRAYEVKGAVHVRLSEFEVGVPSYLGVTVQDDVDVDVEFKVEDV